MHSISRWLVLKTFSYIKCTNFENLYKFSFISTHFYYGRKKKSSTALAATSARVPASFLAVQGVRVKKNMAVSRNLGIKKIKAIKVQIE